MELMAAIEGLRALKAPCRVRLVSDSQHLKKGITEFLPRWKATGWLKSNGEPVLNQDLWDQLDQIAQKHDIRWEWSAGHGDHADQNQPEGLVGQPGSGPRGRHDRRSLPPDIVLLGDLIELVPKILIQDRLAIRFEPTGRLPPW